MILAVCRAVAEDERAFLPPMEELVRDPDGRFFSFSSSSAGASAEPFDTGGTFATYVLEVEVDGAWEADWDRWRIARSDGFRRLSFMLLLARWPGVWLRGSGTGSSSESSESWYTVVCWLGDAVESVLFERTDFVFVAL